MVVVDSFSLKVVILDCSEKESQDTIGELRLFSAVTTDQIWLKCVDNMHFKIH